MREFKEKCHAPRSGQPRSGDFVRASATEMHMDLHKATFTPELTGKKPRPPNLAARFVRAVEMHMDVSQEQFYARIYRKNATLQDQDNPAAQTLCEPAQWKCTWASHKATFTREFTGKMLGAKGFDSCRNNPSVWTVFGGKNCSSSKSVLSSSSSCPRLAPVFNIETSRQQATIRHDRTRHDKCCVISWQSQNAPRSLDLDADRAPFAGPKCGGWRSAALAPRSDSLEQTH